MKSIAAHGTCAWLLALRFSERVNRQIERRLRNLGIQPGINISAKLWIGHLVCPNNLSLSQSSWQN